MDNGNIREQITDIEYAYVQCIDDDRLEEWPGFFVEDCVYHILPRENAEEGLPLGIFYCHNQAQLRDRVVILRKAAVFSLRYYRHLISNIRIVGERDGVHDVHANYVVHATDVLDGTTIIFSAGKYEDKVTFEGGAPRFVEKIVLADTYSIPSNLSAPL